MALPDRGQRRLSETPRPEPASRPVLGRGDARLRSSGPPRWAHGRLVGTRGRSLDPGRLAAGADLGDRGIARRVPERAGDARRPGPVESRDRGAPGPQRPRREDSRAPRPVVSPEAAGRCHDDVGHDRHSRLRVIRVVMADVTTTGGELPAYRLRRVAQYI